MTTLGKRFSNSELSAFCTQMAMILKSGLSVFDGLEVLRADASPQMQTFFDALSASLSEGTPLGEALRSTGCFPDYACDMTDIGVSSGRTDEIMESLAAHYEQEEANAAAIRSAVTYPGVMIGMMLAVLLVLMTRVLPVFNQVFLQLGSRLTGFSRWLMDAGSFLSRHVVWFILLALLLCALVFRFVRSPRFACQRRKLLLLLPPLRRFSQKLSVGRFASGLSIALSSGLMPEEAMQMAQRLVTDPVVQQKTQHFISQYQNGASLAQAAREAQLFSGLYSQMLSVGCQSGATETVLLKISRQYAEESQDQLARIISILEPTLVALLSCFVGLILLSVMLPLLGIMSSVSTF